MKRITVFYAGLIYEEFEDPNKLRLHELPDGAYIHLHRASGGPGDPKWLKKDFTPVLIEDVPKELRTMLLLMS